MTPEERAALIVAKSQARINKRLDYDAAIEATPAWWKAIHTTWDALELAEAELLAAEEEAS